MRPNAAHAPPPSGPVRLGEWAVYPERNLLQSPEIERHIEPRAMDTLCLLIARRGEVVSKDELIDAVWEGRIISEGTLTNTVAELRGALGDDARHPRFIETIPKRGYRLVCPVEAVEDAPEQPTDASTGRRRLWWIASAAVAAIAMAAALVLLFGRSREVVNPRRVVVAPFVNRTGDPGLDPAGMLARDRLVGQLSGSGIAEPEPLDGSAQSSLETLYQQARERGAGLAISGALYLHEGEVEIEAQLVDVATRSLLYAAPPAAAPREAAATAVDAVIQRVLGALSTHVYAHAHSSLMSRPPILAAHREFLAASELFASDAEGAVRHLERALELDPDYTSAKLRLAMAYRGARRMEEGRAVLEDLQARRAGLTEFERLWVDSMIANFEGRWEEALSGLEQIHELAPADWTTLHLISICQQNLNRPRRAIAAIESLHAADLPEFVTRQPIYGTSFRNLATAWHIVGDHTAELAAARAGRANDPAGHTLLAAEAKALVALGDADALEELLAAAESTPMSLTPAKVLVEAAATARAHGRPDLSLALADRAVARLRDAADSPVEQLLLGKALVLRGDLDDAQPVLESVVSRGDAPRSYVLLAARGWLGAVAARRGELEVARAVDQKLQTIDDPYLYGAPLYYRASIAAWLGHRDEALQLLRAARAAGWSGYFLLHDEERVLFEPLEGTAEYEAMLHPVE